MNTKVGGFRMDVFKIGLLGGLVITFAMMVARAIEVTPMNYELSLGAVLTTQMDAIAWIVGFCAHLAISGAIAFLYFAGFRAVKRSGFWIGTQFGLVHWALSGVLMAFVPRLYSLVPGIMEPPGLFGLNFGLVNFAGNLAAHLGYGALVGALLARLSNALVSRPGQDQPISTPSAGETDRDKTPSIKHAA